jgi:hypothetical protein
MNYIVTNLPTLNKNLSFTFTNDVIRNDYFRIKVDSKDILEAATKALEILSTETNEISLNDVMFVYDEDSVQDNNPFCVETKLILSNAGLHYLSNNF